MVCENHLFATIGLTYWGGGGEQVMELLGESPGCIESQVCLLGRLRESTRIVYLSVEKTVRLKKQKAT